MSPCLEELRKAELQTIRWMWHAEARLGQLTQWQQEGRDSEAVVAYRADLLSALEELKRLEELLKQCARERDE